METMTSSTAPLHSREPDTFDDFPMHQELLFSYSLKDLKNLRKQLYSAAEYFELSYANDDSRQIVVSTLKNYAIKALVNTVDHLGSASYKVNDFLDEKVSEVSGTEICVSSIEQRVRTCQTHIDHEGLSQQSLVINTPKFHKRYILPDREIMHGADQSKTKYEESILDSQENWHGIKNAVRATIVESQPSFVRKVRSQSPSQRVSQRPGNFISNGRGTTLEKQPSVIRKGRSQSPSQKPRQPGNFSSNENMSKNDLVLPEKRTVSPHRFPLLRTGSLSSRPTTSNSRATTPTPTSFSRSTTQDLSRSTSPNLSRSTTPNLSRSTTPNSRRGYPSETLKSVSMRLPSDRRSPKENNQISTKGKRLLKALLSRRESKKDDTLYTYLDEY
ncbi:protein ABIL3-like isoform X2 [Apium graveolens]|uniref:protein ABIL3-like isoform X2 n=1 Tax=Apium graveolens TaxID=4045 RepID=UPI003D7B09C1